MLRYLPSEELLYGRIVHNGHQNIHFTWFAYTTPFLVICDISAWKAIGIQYGVSNEIWLESSLRTAVIDEIRYLELTWFASVGHCSKLLAYANNFFYVHYASRRILQYIYFSYPIVLVLLYVSITHPIKVLWGSRAICGASDRVLDCIDCILYNLLYVRILSVRFIFCKLS